VSAGGRRFDLWGVPFDGGATLGWPGARYAPRQVRQALEWMWMRVHDGRIYDVDGERFIEVPDDLFVDRGDVAVVPHDLMATLDACSARSDAIARLPSVALQPILSHHGRYEREEVVQLHERQETLEVTGC
jgi:arginase family enzyme